MRNKRITYKKLTHKKITHKKITTVKKRSWHYEMLVSAWNVLICCRGIYKLLYQLWKLFSTYYWDCKSFGPVILPVGTCPAERCIYVHHISIWMYITALFEIAQTWKQHQYPSALEKIHKLGHNCMPIMKDYKVTQQWKWIDYSYMKT